jgi:hypothetical protein
MQPGPFLKTSANWVNLLVLTFAVCLLVLNIELFKQNSSLRSDIQSLRVGRVAVGQQLRGLAGVALNGYLRAIALPTLPSEKLLIIGFSPDCPYCKANQSGWQVLAGKIRERKGWRVMWVSRDSTNGTLDYCRTQGIPFSEVVAEPPESTYVQLGLRAVPKMILIGPGGIVEKVWSGQLEDAQWTEAFSSLMVSRSEISDGNKTQR